MTIKELIKILSSINEEEQNRIVVFQENGSCYHTEIHSIEFENYPYDYNENLLVLKN